MAEPQLRGANGSPRFIEHDFRHGLFVQGGRDGRLVFHPLPPPTDAEVQRLGARVARRLTKLAHRHLTSWPIAT